MLLSELAQKELIQVEDGVRYGFLADTDLHFRWEDRGNYRIRSEEEVGSVFIQKRSGNVR